MSGDVLAIVCSDIHLSLTPPVGRSVEPDWLVSQGRILGRLQQLRKRYSCPVLCAGDVFDRWHCSPELINFAIANLPEMFSVPGQHDMPMHRMEDLERSAFHTLCLCGTVRNLKQDIVQKVGSDLVVFGYGWGVEEGPGCRIGEGLVDFADPGSPGGLSVAVMHRYVWSQGCGYPGAPTECLAGRALRDMAKHFDVIISGDNHHHFSMKIGDCTVYNCGCLIRRKLDERDLNSGVGLLRSDGTVEFKSITDSAEVWLESVSKTEPEQDMELGSFLEELANVGWDGVDFNEAVMNYARKNVVSEKTKNVLIELLEEKEDGTVAL